LAVISESLHVVLNAMHTKSQREAERNSPERSECTSGLAARRTKLWQGADTAEAHGGGEGALQDVRHDAELVIRRESPT